MNKNKNNISQVTNSNNFEQINKLRNKLKKIELQLSTLTKKKEQIKKELIQHQITQSRNNILQKNVTFLGCPILLNPPITIEEKIELFLRLFRCRESVFPKLWENKKNNRKGYSPACKNEWVLGKCLKPKVKCTECKNQEFVVFDEIIADAHLRGKYTVGTYAIKRNDSCIFLAADFDGDGWQEEIMAYKLAAEEMKIQVSIERSRSGNGGHAWIFFIEPIPAKLAREIGSYIISKAIAEKHTIKLKAYDRFFPNQDFILKNGFGNLIALPLQRIPRNHDNSVFIDENFNPYPDQWDYLSRISCLSRENIENLVQSIDNVETNRVKVNNENELSEKKSEKVLDIVNEKFHPDLYKKPINISISSQIKINISEMPSPLISAFRRTATFPNPKYFELQRLRFSTFKTPKYIFCGELFLDHIILPRGCLDNIFEISKKAGASIELEDTRLESKKFRISFIKKLRFDQKRAVEEIQKYNTGVLVTEPGCGKTVMACALIAKRKLPTLIVVHRTSLLNQWRERVEEFLKIDSKQIGIIAAQKKKICGKLDIAMLQTLSKMEDLENFLSRYSQIIVDECHHIAAFSFEMVLKKCIAKYILGLTATPYRKDGHHPIIHMQCGPIRYEMKHRETKNLIKKVIVKETEFQIPENQNIQTPIHKIWEYLVLSHTRNNLICNDILTEIQKKRTPLVISERKDHLGYLLEILKSKTNNNISIFLLDGDLSQKYRNKALKNINKLINHKKQFCILSTGSLIGEGFDLPVLDTLFLTMPIAFKGKMVQYAGRIHREFKGKEEVRIYDYVDNCIALTISMYKKRRTVYRKMNYELHAPKALDWKRKPKQSVRL